MNKVLLGLTVLVSLVYGQETISTPDLLGATLIDGRDTMQLTAGAYRDSSDFDADYYQLNFNHGLTAISNDKKSAAVTVMQCAGGYGNGRTYLIGYAVKTNGKTCIRIGDSYGGSKANIIAFSYISSVIQILMQESDFDTKRVLKTYKIIHFIPTLTF
jgi:hypothetical protein